MNTQLSCEKALRAGGITAGAFLSDWLTYPLATRKMDLNGLWSYTWDGENRLIRMVSTNLTRTLTFEYDYQGLRIG